MWGKTVLSTAIVAIALLGGLAGKEKAPLSRPATQTAPCDTQPAWEVVKGEGFTIAIPRGWRKLPMPIGHHVLYVNGDGLGVPAIDETGSPIQTGLTVERYSKLDSSTMEGAKENLASLKWNRRLKVVSQDKVKALKLSDGAEAALIRVILLKDRTRRSLQLKLYAKDKDSRGWVVSAWIVTSKDSEFVAKNKSLENWLRAHVTSLCFDREKFNTAALRVAYSPAQTQPATSSRPTTTSAPTGGNKGR